MAFLQAIVGHLLSCPCPRPLIHFEQCHATPHELRACYHRLVGDGYRFSQVQLRHRRLPGGPALAPPGARRVLARCAERHHQAQGASAALTAPVSAGKDLPCSQLFASLAVRCSSRTLLQGIQKAAPHGP